MAKIDEKKLLELGIEIFGSAKEFGHWLELPDLSGIKPIELSLEEIYKKLQLISCYV